MVKNGNGKKDNKENSKKLKSHTKYGIIAIVFFVFALFFLMSAINHQRKSAMPIVSPILLFVVMAVIIVSRLMVPMHQPAPVSIRGVKGKRAR